VRTHYKFRKFEVFAPKSADVRIWRTPDPSLSAKWPYWTNPPHPWVRMSFMDSPLLL